MSFPNTDKVVANLGEASRAGMTLLEQYQRLCRTHEQTIETFRTEAARVPALEARVKELERKCAEMDAHPSVIAAKKAAALARLTEAQAELDTLGATPSTTAPG